MPPKPMLRRKGTGTTTSATRLIATVTPEASDRATGGLHRDDDGFVVVVAVRALLTPSRDDEQRVVDRDTEADQGDQELHDEAHVAERGQAEHEQERREDRDRGDDQRHQREE